MILALIYTTILMAGIAGLLVQEHRISKLALRLRGIFLRRLARLIDDALYCRKTFDVVGVQDDGFADMMEVRGLAAMLADEANTEAGFVRDIYREVMDRGGICYKKGKEDFESVSVPYHYRRKNGMPIDEIASEMGMTDDHLIQEIQNAERARKALPRNASGKRERAFVPADFYTQAENILIGQVRIYNEIPF